MTCPTKTRALTSSIIQQMDDVGAWQQGFLLDLFDLWLCLHGRYNFMHLGRYGGKTKAPIDRTSLSRSISSPSTILMTWQQSSPTSTFPTLYQKLKQEQPSLSFQEWKFNNLGLQLGLNPETSDFGIKVHDLAVTLFPESANLYDSLAEVHFFAGNSKEAILNSKKSLALNPENGKAVNRLKQLKN
jgi:hypothetical protein